MEIEFFPKDNNKAVRILLNVIGILLIIVGSLVGWLPGPWFLLGLVTGLTLLARNNLWAHKHLSSAKNKLHTVKNKVSKKIKKNK